jgi:hypothetical protein
MKVIVRTWQGPFLDPAGQTGTGAGFEKVRPT